MIPFLGDFIDGQFVKPSQPNGHIEKYDPGDTKQMLLEATYQFESVNMPRARPREKAFRSWAGPFFR